MSLGSLSPETHENNAIAMNRLGANANTGEGGEPPERFDTEKECTTKQVASGRFGVTSHYLSSADEIQIKMAQGSKPGEGGHLPGKKVNEMIAHVRYATPGVGLISPPPLHDIYSIEDLKQLIFDLKSANPDADINVKLVSEAGIGTIAAGVSKAKADVVHISGHDGGTGASPKTSIKNAGLPWELGLAEANQMLRATGLRSRIRVSVDGGMKTGRDVAVAALLGGEGYAFGTASLVTSGCVMARQCHENTCPVGVATQDENLRAASPASPARHQLHDVHRAGTARDHGRTRLRDSRRDDRPTERTQAARRREPAQGPEARPLGRIAEPADNDGRYKQREQTHEVDEQLDWDLIDAAEDAIYSGDPVAIDTDITNVDRAVGATLSNRISREHAVTASRTTLSGSTSTARPASPSARSSPGRDDGLTGAANDYVGKGLSGGRVIVTRPPGQLRAAENILIGNVALYGATQGDATSTASPASASPSATPA